MVGGALEVLATVAAAAASAAAAALPATPAPRPIGTSFSSVRAAIEATLIETDPVVVGFGEWHQTSATATIAPTLRRFTDQVLPELGPRLSHFIVETWMTSGRCGPVEEAVTRGIASSIDRPAATEDDIADALRAAHGRGAAPRILTMSCDDYRAMRGTSGPSDRASTSPTTSSSELDLDFDRTLRLTGDALRRTIETALLERARPGPRPGPPPVPRPMVAVYGGALHNDVYPLPGLESYSYARSIRFATLGRYLEIDLVIPEYAETSPLLRAQDWWSVYRHVRRAGRATRIRRGPGAFVIVFPAAAAAAAAPAASRNPRRHPRGDIGRGLAR
jgi:hypothetical protein